MATITSAAPYLSLLGESDPQLKTYALESLNSVADELWAEIANDITEIEELYEDHSFSRRQLAALLASKVYYNLGDYEAAVKYALLAGPELDLSNGSEYVETIVSHCIEQYVRLSQSHFNDKSIEIEPQLVSIFEQMVAKCVTDGETRLALGISLEGYRLDLVNKILQDAKKSSKSDESVRFLVGYVLSAVTTQAGNIELKTACLTQLAEILLTLENPDYFLLTKIVVQLNDSSLVVRVFKGLLATPSNAAIAYQIAFDLVGAASQQLLAKVTEELSGDASNSMLLRILSGVPTCDLDLTFLSDNNAADHQIMAATRKALDGRSSLFHSAVSFTNAFMFAGTTDDSFFRSNLEWLGRSSAWSKFSATVAFGVIHRGSLSQGRNVLQPYLPGSTTSPYTNGGALYGLGLIYAGHGKEVLDYLRQQIVDNADNADDKDADIVLHGACLGTGLAGMGLADPQVYEELKAVLYADSAVSGQAAAFAMGLVMLGSGNTEAIHDMYTYAQETQHETIVRGLVVGIALICCGKEDAAEPIISQLLSHQDANLRYGGCFTLALAYCGTSNKTAIRRLLHIGVSDSSDNVRRVAVMGLGFVLLLDYQSVPTVVELLSQSHNAHVRYGAAMALGISCAGRGLQSAIEVLDPLAKDSVDFVREGATIAKAMILIQQTEKTYPKVKEFREQLTSIVANKHEESLARFGATLAQGILDAGGRNVTIQLENHQTNTLNTKAIVGLTMFVQFWYWFPLAHFLCLSFTPTAIIGVTDHLKVPKFKINCHCPPDVFGYPPKAESQVKQQAEKLTTAVLSTTARAKARAALKAKERKEEDKDEMDVDEKEVEEKKEEEDGEVGEDSKKEEEEEEDDSEETSTEPPVSNEELQSSTLRSLYVKNPYQLDNMTRVVPAQLKYITFSKDERFTPVRKFRGISGIVVLKDSTPSQPFDKIRTVREKNNTEAPVPDPFTIDPAVDKGLFEIPEDED
ncbi:DEKNAAC102970 [Brettanomyces naardenensis]|uniref:26S proteasome regulatory subunit RPN2 n=1 Tax=Brettanomyces naardenensis TaxID=13370 RepID=A0A448YM32_BRENA|nr:DEKNAAC102970 [Brettanomyces naardenensis]